MSPEENTAWSVLNSNDHLRANFSIVKDLEKIIEGGESDHESLLII